MRVAPSPPFSGAHGGEIDLPPQAPFGLVQGGREPGLLRLAEDEQVDVGCRALAPLGDGSVNERCVDAGYPPYRLPEDLPQPGGLVDYLLELREQRVPVVDTVVLFPPGLSRGDETEPL